MRLKLVTLLLCTAAAAPAGDAVPVVLAASRNGRVEIYDGRGLRWLGAIGVNPGVESISTSPDGRRIYIAQENPHDGRCCGLFALDLKTWEMCLFAGQGNFAVSSHTGRYLFTQPESDQIRLMDAQSLSTRLPLTVERDYNLQPSPDDAWLFGLANAPKPVLDIFDV